MTGGNLTVAAVRCVDGHLNPLIATSCRVCAKTVPPQELADRAAGRRSGIAAHVHIGRRFGSTTA